MIDQTKKFEVYFMKRLEPKEGMTDKSFYCNKFKPYSTFGKESFGDLNLIDYYSLNGSKILSTKQEIPK
jgi:hypothetical protein